MCRESLIDFSNYEIYEDGRIWSKHWKRFIEGTETLDGYLRINLITIKGISGSFMWNRVIYYFYNGDIPDGMYVNHKDEDKKNNSISNLNLLTHEQNCNWGTRNERISKSHKGKKLGSPSEEARKKISEAQKKRFETDEPWNKGKKNCFSEDTILKMRKSQKNKPINLLNDEGVILKSFESLMDAERQLGINASSIMRCCQGKQKTAGGFHWEYA